MLDVKESDVLTIKPYDRFILPKQNLGFTIRLDSHGKQTHPYH